MTCIGPGGWFMVARMPRLAWGGVDDGVVPMIGRHRLVRLTRPPGDGRPYENTWTRFWAGSGLLVLVVAGGTGGYMMLGLSLGDAVYQTVVTVTTVGYREIGVEAGTITASYKAFTVVLILLGTGTVLYTLSVLIESIFEGRLDEQVRRRRMRVKIDRLAGHVVLCGFGQVGQAIYAELMRSGSEVVVIDRRDRDDFHDYHGSRADYWVTGEATDDYTLKDAGLDRADTLVLALDSDIDNLFVSLTARSMAPALLIVTRASEASVESKLRQAGADHVVNPHEIGGSRMAALALSDSGAATPVPDVEDRERGR